VIALRADLQTLQGQVKCSECVCDCDKLEEMEEILDGGEVLVAFGSGVLVAKYDFKKKSGRRSSAKLLTKDEARRIAANFAKLPELFQRARLTTSV
jgi:hypothetical protein